MGTYNILHTAMPCPRCGKTAGLAIEMFFGDTRAMGEYSPGDTIPWTPGKTVPHGGRPDNGDLDGEGYAECSLCRRDFFVKVLIRADVISGVVPDTAKKPYLPD